MDAAVVSRLAELAELDLTAEERDAIARDLGRILAHVEEIAALPLDDVPTTDRVLAGEAAASRADVPSPGLDRAEALRAAPRSDDGAFVVPGFVDEG